MTAVEVRGLRFSWPGFDLAVDRLDVPVGARAGVVGPSGCGKSTLLGLIAGELVPTAGEVRVAGEVLSALEEPARRAWRLRHVGMVFQGFALVDHLDVLGNVVLPYRLGGGLRLDTSVWARARSLLDELGVGALAARRPASLSTGERQRVAIARALVTDPALLLADEPTSGLDPDRTEAVMSLLEAVCAARGMTLVMVSHDPTLRPRFAPLLDLGAR